MKSPQHSAGATAPDGAINLAATRDLGDLRPRPPLSWHARNWLRYRRRDVPKAFGGLLLGRVAGVAVMHARLSAAVYRPELRALAPWQLEKLKALLASSLDVRQLPRYFGGQVLDYGTLSTRVVTTAGVGFIVDAFQNLVEVENMKFHGFGTGVTAEAVGDTALVTELTTQYAVDNTRPTGSQTEAAANIYRTVATLSPDTGGTIAVTEHGILSQAATGGGVLLDRSVFSAVNIVAGSDSLQATYDLTVTAGS